MQLLVRIGHMLMSLALRRTVVCRLEKVVRVA